MWCLFVMILCPFIETSLPCLFDFRACGEWGLCVSSSALVAVRFFGLAALGFTYVQGNW